MILIDIMLLFVTFIYSLFVKSVLFKVFPSVDSVDVVNDQLICNPGLSPSQDHFYLFSRKNLFLIFYLGY